MIGPVGVCHSKLSFAMYVYQSLPTRILILSTKGVVFPGCSNRVSKLFWSFSLMIGPAGVSHAKLSFAMYVYRSSLTCISILSMKRVFFPGCSNRVSKFFWSFISMIVPVGVPHGRLSLAMYVYRSFLTCISILSTKGVFFPGGSNRVSELFWSFISMIGPVGVCHAKLSLAMYVYRSFLTCISILSTKGVFFPEAQTEFPNCSGHSFR
jgi:hypothetical protein